MPPISIAAPIFIRQLPQLAQFAHEGEGGVCEQQDHEQEADDDYLLERGLAGLGSGGGDGGGGGGVVIAGGVIARRGRGRGGVGNIPAMDISARSSTTVVTGVVGLVRVRDFHADVAGAARAVYLGN